MYKLFAALIVVAIIIYIIVKRRQIAVIPVPASLPWDSIILPGGQSLELSPNYKLTYTPDGNVCINYKYKNSTVNICEPLFNNPTRDQSFTLIDHNLTFNSYLGNPTGKFNTTGSYGFGIGFLAEKVASAIVESTNDPADQQLIYNDIVGSLRSKIPTQTKITPEAAQK